MSGTVRFALRIAAALAAAAAQPAFADSCHPDFGDKALRWVDDDAARQSRELATADFAARTFNYRLVGYERLHRRIELADQELRDVARQIAELDRSTRTDVALAVERERLSERLLTRLYKVASDLESMRQQNEALGRSTDRAAFVREGLTAVGRETLIASMRELGSSSASSLAGRYSVYVQVTFNSAGEPESGFGQIGSGGGATSAATTVGVGLIETGNPYAAIGGAVLIVGGLVVDGACIHNWDVQRERLVDASNLLPAKLIGEGEQWALFQASETANIRDFAPEGVKVTAAVDALYDRWKILFAANAARAGAAEAVLTTAKVEQIRRDLAAGIDPAGLRRQVAITEVAAGVGELNAAIARGRTTLLAACLDDAGLAVEEDQREAVDFVRAQLRALQAQTAMAPLQDLILRSDALAATASQEIGSRGPSATRRQCRAAPRSSLAAGRLVRRVTRGPAAASVRLVATTARGRGLAAVASRRAPRGRAQSLVPRNVGRARLAARLPGRLGAVDAGRRVADAMRASLGFCVTIRSGSTYSCGSDGSGPAYGGGFIDTGDARRDIHDGAGDGGYAQDSRRMSQAVDAASGNIERRIADTRRRVADVRTAFPTWLGTNLSVLGAVESAARAGRSADQANEASFEAAAAPLLAGVRQELADFTTGAADQAAIARLVQASGEADMRLPEIARERVPADVPEVVGFTAVEAAYGDEQGSFARQLVREARRAGRDLPNGGAEVGLSRRLLDAAAWVGASPRGGGGLGRQLVLDASSLRYVATGSLVGGTIAVVRPDGAIVREPLQNADGVPADALVNVVGRIRNDLDYFQVSADRLQADILAGTLFPGRRGVVLSTARGLRDRAMASLAMGDVRETRVWLDMALGALDVATRFIPGVDWGRDVYEAVTGRDLFSGAKLDSVDRIAAVVGVLSAGIADEFVHVRQVVEKLDDLPVGKLDELYEFGKTATRETEQILHYNPHATERMVERGVSRGEVAEVLGDHTPFYSVEHGSYTAVGHTSQRAERVGVAVGTETGEIRTVMIEDKIPFEELRFTEGPHAGKRRYIPIDLDD